SDEWTSPLYAPVDEAHPFIFEESYALSKEVNERSALMWSRRCETAFVGMRFPWTNTPEKTLELARRFNDEDNLPPDPRFPKGIVAKILWTYLDLRDAVKAIEVVINSDIKGASVYNFAAPDIMAKAPTLELMQKFHPKNPKPTAGPYGSAIEPSLCPYIRLCPAIFDRPGRHLGGNPRSIWPEFWANLLGVR
ncbi:MAG: hypothetical protein NTV53_04730, partial [Actinobacteria bacterium]|nr:hypothetical protein [Actinomycetota bacterium]